ncbi:uncharacterized protein LOC124290982 [Haliotis rubra]|uniref:uncharacterized protein LOC124290982 n=1 Tax=Haliotis rubra TaxID=36100 RepID=UPI001EE5CF3C|nr:uncharacterized protein LOC124290982 [Haliotis rubra]
MSRPLEPAVHPPCQERDKFQVDFEMAAIRAVELEFPAAEVKGCFFHYTQAIWRKTQELGLAVMYREDPLVERWVRRAAALPLLPLRQVQDAWVDTMNSSPDVPGSQTFNDYITTTWVDDDARFPLPIWNHHDTFGPRTNNNIEGFHSRLNATLSHRHPKIFRFMEIIWKIEKAEKAKLCQLDLGGAPQSRKRLYREIDNRLHRLKDQLADGTKNHMQYLDAVGKLLKI